MRKSTVKTKIDIQFIINQLTKAANEGYDSFRIPDIWLMPPDTAQSTKSIMLRDYIRQQMKKEDS